MIAFIEMIDINDVSTMPTEADLINAIFGVSDQLDDLRAAGKEKEANELTELLVAVTSTMTEHPSRSNDAGEWSYEGPCFCHECIQYGAG